MDAKTFMKIVNPLFLRSEWKNIHSSGNMYKVLVCIIRDNKEDEVKKLLDKNLIKKVFKSPDFVDEVYLTDDKYSFQLGQNFPHGREKKLRHLVSIRTPNDWPRFKKDLEELAKQRNEFAKGVNNE